MTLANRRSLRQVDERAVERLLALSGDMMKEALAILVPAKAEARAAQLAVLVQIMTAAPLRNGKIAAPELGRTLHTDGQ